LQIRLQRTATALAFAVLGGCASSPQSAFYTLSVEQAPARLDAAMPLAIAVGPATVPEMVDRPQLVLRVSANQIRIDEFARWAEPLRSQIPQVIAADLAQHFAGARVTSFPQRSGLASAYQVLVDVQAFESSLGETSHLVVLWSVRPPRQGDVVTGRSIVDEPAGAPGYEALVNAHSRALAAVTRDIAAAIRSTLQ